MADSRAYSLKKLSLYPFAMARQSKVIQFLLSILFGLGMMYWLSDPSFTQTQNLVLLLLFLAIALWITEAIPPFSVGILVIGYLVVVMGTDENQHAMRYVQTWSDGVIWLFLGGFFLAEGMKKTRLDEALLGILLPKFGKKPEFILLGLMLTTAVISMLMSNTATTAMMIATVSPIFASLDKKSNFSRALLLGIPTAASIGGMGTIIGSAPNAIAVGALEAVGISISFLEWMVIGVPIALLLLYIFWRILLRRYRVGREEMTVQFALPTVEHSDQLSNKELRLQKNIMMVVLGITLFFWLTSKWFGIPIAAVSGIPIVALTMLGILDADDVRALPWDTLMLVAGGLALGMAIQEQELAAHFVDKLSGVQINFYLLMLLFGFITVLLSNFMSNTAATTILVPIALSLMSISSGDFSPATLPLIIALSASCALLLPVSTPPNAIAFSTGLIKQSEFRLGGVSMGLLGPVSSIVWVLAVTSILN
ncbi:DASS family sodium-coupled anion symporter [Testudinibacter sp. TR-2022]|nr:DASS family sodium-coupled anion symporter [Pasteurellaceae bacterium Phil31]TNH10444.1 DASS family sodium-coupled anion symporter [Testudinibacter sp. TR-2022]TNH10738.1 DASS family sodium-coupled anion symporter [Testudinibacter sp. TR-2022]TNH13448.1 DASS family sodium-coupled anion symporter [Testudinibacter sp. TR-2022]TNH14978.1 DASS family sodium-coupled anion symporter [Testudinibacter sp. TR-2022]